jgi:hypothetical protein
MGIQLRRLYLKWSAVSCVCVNSWTVQQAIPASDEIQNQHVKDEKWIVILPTTLKSSASASRGIGARSFYFQVHHVLLLIS